MKNVVFCYHTTDMEYHLGIALLSSAIQNREVNSSLVIFREIKGKHFDTVEETIERILEKQPMIVAFSVMTFNWHRIQKVISGLSSVFNGFIVVGGCHAILCPDEILAFPGVDAVCLGDGEQPMIDLIRNLDALSTKPFLEIPGLRFKSSSAKNMNKPWCNEDIHKYPYLNLDLFHQERNQPLQEKITGSFAFTGVFSLPAITSRGCPYGCTYCNNKSFMEILGGKKKYLRKYSPEVAVDFIKRYTHRYNPEFLEFMDEMFIKSSSWIEEFCDLYKHNIDLPFSINARIDRCSEDIIKNLANTGLSLVFFGLESGDEQYRSDYLDRHMTNSEILHGAETLRKHNVMLVTYNIFGMPFETPRHLERTIELNRLIMPDAAAAFVYQPLPGTKLGKLASEHDLFKPHTDEYWDYLVPALDTELLPANYVQEKVSEFRAEFNSWERTSTFIEKFRKLAQRI